MPNNNPTIVIEFPETPGDFHPVIGRSGLHIGLALHDSQRGVKCLRMPLAKFRKIRYDLFNCKRNGQFPIPDVEFAEEDSSVVNTEKAEKEIQRLRAIIAEKESLLREADEIIKTLKPVAEGKMVTEEASSVPQYSEKPRRGRPPGSSKKVS